VIGIPWDELNHFDRAAIIWTVAALFATMPSALAAVLWVQAWRGVPRFSPPRCRGCRVELRGTELSLPERCPECGRATHHLGKPHVDYAVRAWRFRSVLVRFALGAICTGLAIGLGWLGGAFMIRGELAAKATARPEAVEAALMTARSVRMALDGLRFAADSIRDDVMVQAAANKALTALERNEIPLEQGLALLLDRLDTAAARPLVMDLIGSLGEAGLMDKDRALALCRRVSGGPQLVAPVVIAPDDPLILTLMSGASTVNAVLIGVTLNGESFGPMEAVAIEGVRGVAAIQLPPLSLRADGAIEDGETAVHHLAVSWRLEWPRILTGDESEAEAPNAGEPRFVIEGQDAISVAVSAGDGMVIATQRVAELAAVDKGAASPFLAQALQPQVFVRSYGDLCGVSGRLQAALRPGVMLRGNWSLVVGDHRIPVTAVEGSEALELAISGLVALPPHAIPPSMTLEYDPAPLEPRSRPGRGADAPVELPSSGIARWYATPFQIENVSWTWGTDP
jgi:hypothetical protein